MKRWTVMAVICLLLGACRDNGAEASAREAVLATLNAPASARFGQFSRIGENFACLTFNSKDATGEYFGDQQAFLRKNVNGWSVITGFVSDHEDCIEITKRMMPKD